MAPTSTDRAAWFAAPLLHAALVVLACFAVYANAYDHAFHLDSQHVIVDNPAVRNLANIPRYFVDASTFTSLRPNVDYRPVLQASYALDYRLGGYEMERWHFTQILLHALCAMGLYGLARKVLQAGSSASPTATNLIALAAALIYALHPTHAGVVDYLSARSSLLTAALLLPAILLYMVPVGHARYGRTPWGASLFFGLAIFCKVEAVACLAVFFLYDVWQTRVENGPKRSFFGDLTATLRGRTLRRLAPILAIVAVYFLVRREVMAPFEYEAASRRDDVSHLEYLATQVVAWWHYVGRWVLAVDYVADDAAYPVYRSLRAPRLLAALGAWVVAAACALRWWRSRPYVLFLGASALALISPTSSIVPLAEMVNEHRPYLPLGVLSLAVLLPIGLGARELIERAHGEVRVRPVAAIIAGLGFAVLLIGLGGLTYERNRVFATAESYWKDVVEKAPSGRAHLNYGLTFMNQGDYETALEHFQTSLDYSPYWHITHTNLGVLYDTLGQATKAAEHHDRAVDYDTYSGTSRTWRGEHHLRHKRFAAALADFEASQPKSLEHFSNWRGIATAQAGLGRSAEAHQALLECLRLDHERTELEIVPIITPFFDDEGRYQAGIDFFERLEEQLPEAWWVHRNKAILAARLGQDELANRALTRAEELQAASTP